MSLELRVEIDTSRWSKNIYDSTNYGSVGNWFRQANNFPIGWQTRPRELLILQGSHDVSASIDKITKYSLLPSELRYLVDQVGTEFR